MMKNEVMGNEVIHERAFSLDPKYRLFLSIPDQSNNKRKYDEEQLSLFGEGQGSGL
jgi:hypothetical protein